MPRPCCCEIMRSKNPKMHLRRRLVMSALTERIRAAVRSVRCSRNTVNKWLRRWQGQSLGGFQERSRDPHRISHKTPPDYGRLVLAARDAIPCSGPRRLKRHFQLACLTGAICPHPARVRLQPALLGTLRGGAQLGCGKLTWPAFGLLQADVGDLSDLAWLLRTDPLGAAALPRHPRIVPEVGIRLAFNQVNDSTHALALADHVLAHLASGGVRLNQLIVESYSGSEFGGNWNRCRRLPAFARSVGQNYGCGPHALNPPPRSTCNGDMEAVHGLVERELYQVQRLTGDFRAFLNGLGLSAPVQLRRGRTQPRATPHLTNRGPNPLGGWTGRFLICLSCHLCRFTICR